MPTATNRAAAIAERLLTDDDVRDHLRVAVGSLSEATRRAVGKPEPEPPKRRGRRLAALLIALALVALVRDMHRRQQSATAVPGPPGS